MELEPVSRGVMEAVASGPGSAKVASFWVGVRRGWVWALAITILCGAAGLAYSAAQPKAYESRASLYVTSGFQENSSSAYQGSLASEQRVTSYIKLVDSDAVLEQAIRVGGLSESLADLRREVSASYTPETVLLSVSAESNVAQQAARVSNAVADALSSYVSKLETPAGGGLPLAKVTVVTPAKENYRPVAPHPLRNTLLGLAAGVLLSAVFIATRLRFDDRIHDDADLRQVGGPPILATVPTDERLRRRGLLDFGAGATAAAEAFRKLRTNIAFSNVDSPVRKILVTSAIAVEGKTTTAMNLAASIAEAGKRVVLIDADLRRPQVNIRSGLIGEVGLTSYLRGDGAMSDLVQLTEVDGLWVLAAGPTPPNPAELLGSQRSANALKELAESFDYVIVDSPPVLPVTDAVVLAQWVDGVLLVARSNKTKAKDLVDAAGQIGSGPTPVIGFVLTEAPAAKDRYGYYGVKPRRSMSVFGRSREPKAIEQVLEPKPMPKH